MKKFIILLIPVFCLSSVFGMAVVQKHDNPGAKKVEPKATEKVVNQKKSTISTRFFEGKKPQEIKKPQEVKNTEPNYFEGGSPLADLMEDEAYNIPGRFNTKSNWGIYLAGKFLYLKPVEDAMDLGNKVSVSSWSNVTPTTNHGKIISFEPGYKPAFAVNLGIHLPHDNWSIEAHWMHLKFSSKKNLESETGRYIVPALGLFPDLVLTGTSGALLQDFHAKWNFQLNVFDLSIMRSFYMGNSVILKPYLALQGLLNKQHLHTYYNNLMAQADVGNDAEPTYTNSTHLQDKSWSVGPMLGMTADYLFSKHFRVLGDLSLSTFYTDYKLKELANRDDGIIPTVTTDYCGDKIHPLRVFLQSKIGLGWGAYFFKQKAHFDLTLNYEFFILFNGNMLRAYDLEVSRDAISTTPGNLYLHGASVGLRFDF